MREREYAREGDLDALVDRLHPGVLFGFIFGAK
jgi:hypothetical protein